jgi:hypothetical protein
VNKGIQMKLMKVISMMKNLMNKQFQHLTGLQLIQVMNLKMHVIQFVSSAKVIQMKLMKVIDNGENRMNKAFQHWME